MSKTASPITYERSDSKLVCVRRNGSFLCWIEQSWHRSSGLSGQRYSKWSAVVDGTEISAVTLTKAKQKIEQTVAQTVAA